MRISVKKLGDVQELERAATEYRDDFFNMMIPENASNQPQFTELPNETDEFLRATDVGGENE